MAVFKRTGSKFFQVEFQYRGRKVRQSTGTTSKRDAQAFEAELRRKLMQEHVYGVADRDMTLGEALDRWFACRVRPVAKPKAVRDTLSAIQILKQGLGADTQLRDLTAPVIVGWRDGLVNTRTGEPVSPATRNRYADVLNAVLRLAAGDWGVLAKAPSFKPLPLPQRVDPFLSPEEEQRLLDACDATLKPFVTLALDLGGRKNEILGLTWSDITFHEDGGVDVTFVMTKGKRPRTVPAPRRTRELLRAMRQESGPVLRNAKGNQLKSVERLWDRAREAAGLDGYRIHDLRHQFCSKLAMRGVSLYSIQMLAGHSSPSMTARYAHLQPSKLREDIAALD